MTDTQLRFLRAIAERLPIDRVAELYLFPPMRQGALETGIAVVAAVREVAPALDAELAAAPDVALDESPDEANAASAEALGEPQVDPAMDAPPEALTSASAGEACDPTEDASRDADVQAAADAIADVADNVADADATSVAATVATTPSAPPAATPRERHTVYTARYRVTLKGPERGKWELNVVEEADAPLLTVEVVVRGVQQRSGEGAEPERLEPSALRELLGVPAA